jgi:hypothetical protein
MDLDLRKLIEENNKLLIKNLELTRQNHSKIKKIQSHIRRTMIGKILYWLVIIGVTVGALYLSKPYIDNAIDTYDSFRENVDRSSEIINNPGSLFKDVGIIEKLLRS